MLPNLNSSAASSASSSSHSPVLPFGVHHHNSDLGFSLSCFGLPVSAAQSRVGSPIPQPVAVDPVAQWKSAADGMLSLSFDGSGFHYSSDEAIRGAVVKVEEDGDGGGILTNNINGGVAKNNNNNNKGAPAKNLMAERRRRRKLNEKLLVLRSVVPNITKMDRVSILRDAIQYLEELTRKINRLENQLDPVQSPANSQSTSPPTSSVTQATPCFTPTLAKLPAEEISPISLPSPNGQPARIEVRANVGRGMSIHMFCSKSPGVLLSVTRALESVGLEIQKAVVSSFNGLVLDIYCAEQCKEGGRRCVYPEQIKALLLEAIGFSVA